MFQKLAMYDDDIIIIIVNYLNSIRIIYSSWNMKCLMRGKTTENQSWQREQRYHAECYSLHFHWNQNEENYSIKISNSKIIQLTLHPIQTESMEFQVSSRLSFLSKCPAVIQDVEMGKLGWFWGENFLILRNHRHT